MRLNARALVRSGLLGLAAQLALATPGHAGDKTDVLYFRNGDRMTCEIKSLDAGALHVSVDYVDGTISVNWSKVERLDSKKLFIVKLEDGSVYSGTLQIAEAEAGEPTKLQITSGPGDFVLLDKNRIVQMGQTSAKFWNRFAVDISSGIIYSKGNQTAQYNLSSLISYPRPRWAANLAYNSALSSSQNESTSTRNQLDLDAYHLLPWKNDFYSGQAGLLQSTEQGIDLRTYVGGGVGKYFKNSGQLSFSLLGGLAYQHTQYTPTAEAEAPEDLLAVLLTANLRVVSFSKTRLSISANALPALSDPGRFFFNTNATYYLKLWSNLTLNLSFYGNWDTRPPANYSGSDYGFSSGLGWSFGNKWSPQ